MGVPAPPGILSSGQSPYGPRDRANFVVQGTVAAVGPQKAGVFYGPFNVTVWASLALELTTADGSVAAEVNDSSLINTGTGIVSDLVPLGTTVAELDSPDPNDVTLALPIYTLTGNVIVGQSTITGLDSTDWLIGAEVSGPGIVAGSVVTEITVEADPANAILGTVTLDNPVGTPTNVWVDLAQRQPFEFILSEDAIATGVDAAAEFSAGVGSGGVLFQATMNVERSFDGGLSWIAVSDPRNFTDVVQIQDVRVSMILTEPEKGVMYRLNCSAYSDTGVVVNYRLSATGQAATSLNIPM